MQVVITDAMLDLTMAGGAVFAVCATAFIVYCELERRRRRRGGGGKRGHSGTSKGKVRKSNRSRKGKGR